MIDPTNPLPQMNFPAGNLPPNCQTFYNTLAFATNEIHFLGTSVSQEQQAQENGLQMIKKAIEGEPQ